MFYVLNWFTREANLRAVSLTEWLTSLTSPMVEVVCVEASDMLTRFVAISFDESFCCSVDSAFCVFISCMTEIDSAME